MLVCALSACKKDNTPDAQPVDATIKLTYQLAATQNLTLPLKGITIKIRNVRTGDESTAQSDDNGNVTFKSMAIGTYDVSATTTISAADYSRISGNVVLQDVIFNANQKDVVLSLNAANSTTITLMASKVGDWVIKQVYYAGSDRVEGALYRDQFLEFYNNSDQVLYADSLYFGQAWGRQSTSAINHNLQASGQYDWSKAQGMSSSGDANNDYLYMRSLFMIPGTGKQYPVQPGKSIIIAQTATNHKSPFTGTDGVSISVRNQNLTIDLSGADFEAYYAPLLTTKPLNSDIDNPAVPNLEVLSFYGSDMILDNPGRDGYVIFKVDQTQNVKNYPQFYEPLIATPSASARKFYQVPVKYILDAVECQPEAASSRIPKKFNASLDAGYTFTPKGSYTSQSVIRKTFKTVGGRIILKDTNNSTDDFTYLDLANPRGFSN